MDLGGIQEMQPDLRRFQSTLKKDKLNFKKNISQGQTPSGGLTITTLK